MKIKKYLVADMKEGIKRIKRDLGSDAIIIESRRTRRKGLRGFFMPPQIEIIAALDPHTQEVSDNNAVLGKMLEKERQMSSMAEELRELRETVSELSTVSAISEVEEPAAKKITRKKSAAYWRSYLEHHDLDPALLEEIFSEAETAASVPGRMSHARMAEILREKAAAKISCASGFNSRTQIFIGPTGVGKTTTLAKLAARSALDQREKVGLVTIDHYRIGALEQLQAYSEIMDLPFEVVMSPSDLFKVMLRYEKCDRIFIDTAGRSTGNSEELAELAPYIDMLLPADIHLVISATTRRQDVNYITEQFKRLKYNRLILTKLDETSSYGAVMNSTYFSKMPLAYLTDGQRVPEDLKPAVDLDLAGLLWKAG